MGWTSFPRLYAAASLKPLAGERLPGTDKRFPRLYAAASLKQLAVPVLALHTHTFSAALCRGLIEAFALSAPVTNCPNVFRGFMPRPH